MSYTRRRILNFNKKSGHIVTGLKSINNAEITTQQSTLWI